QNNPLRWTDPSGRSREPGDALLPGDPDPNGAHSDRVIIPDPRYQQDLTGPLSCSPGMECEFGDECLLIGGERSMNGGKECRDGGVAAFGHPVVLDRAKDGLDGVEVGTVRRQEVKVDAAPPEGRDGGTRCAAAMDRAVVEHDDRRYRCGR